MRPGRTAECAQEWPKITLVTAVYNGEKYLEATMRSIVNQGYPNLEYIVVDDGSTDGTVEIIRKYEGYVSAWFRQENQGLYAALNAGVREVHWRNHGLAEFQRLCCR